jgi:dGTPase
MSAQQIKTYDDITNCRENIVRFSDEVVRANKQLKGFLFERLYRHPRLIEMNELAGRIIRDLFEVFMNDTSLMTEKFQRRLGEESHKLVVRDYIAGMTDRFALNEHFRIIGTINPATIASKA